MEPLGAALREQTNGAPYRVDSTDQAASQLFSRLLTFRFLIVALICIIPGFILQADR